jgi:hypothetical protein
MYVHYSVTIYARSSSASEDAQPARTDSGPGAFFIAPLQLAQRQSIDGSAAAASPVLAVAT